MPRPVSAQLAAALATVLAVAAPPARAQTVDASLFQPSPPGTLTASRSANSDPFVFSPSIGGDPRHPSRFRRPAAGRDSAGRLRPAEQPAGAAIPPASGAAETGFDSTNAPRRKPRSGQQTAADGATSPSAADKTSPTRPQSVAASSGPLPATFATRPSRAERRGSGPAVLLLPAEPPQRRRIKAPEPDAYEPLGVRAGVFTLFPSIELSGGYDSNPSRVNSLGGARLGIVTPELKVRSDWQRHRLDADIRGTYTSYDGQFVPSLDRPSLDAQVNGRIDATKLSFIDIQGRLIAGTDNPGSPNVAAGLAKLPIFTTLGGTLAYTQRFNRFELTGKGTFDRTEFQRSTLTDGSMADNDDRNFNQYGLGLRGSYELTPGIKPFIEIGADTRRRDIAIDRNGLRRDSDGMTAKIGTTFELTRKLTGEVSAGYLTRRYADPTLPELAGASFDAALIYTPTALTTITGSARSSADEVIVPGISGVLRRDLAIQADHSFRRWLLGTAKVGVGYDDYVGSTREDRRVFASMAMTYKLTRELQLKGEVRRDWLQSNVVNASYTANTFLLGVKLQR